MQAYTQLKNQPLEKRNVRGEAAKARNPFSAIFRVLSRMTTFYDDKRVREMGNPYIWTE